VWCNQHSYLFFSQTVSFASQSCPYSPLDPCTTSCRTFFSLQCDFLPQCHTCESSHVHGTPNEDGLVGGNSYPTVFRLGKPRGCRRSSVPPLVDPLVEPWILPRLIPIVHKRSFSSPWPLKCIPPSPLLSIPYFSEKCFDVYTRNYVKWITRIGRGIMLMYILKNAS